MNYAKITDREITLLKTIDSNLKRMSESGLNKLGIYSYEDIKPSYDEKTQWRVGPRIEFDGSEVTANYEVVDKTASELISELVPAKEAKLAELVEAKTLAENEGVTTSIGLVMKYGENDVVLVDGVVRYTELRNLTTVPKLIEADGTIHTDISLADGKIVLMEQFEAAYTADEKLSVLKSQIEASTTEAELGGITWA